MKIDQSAQTLLTESKWEHSEPFSHFIITQPLGCVGIADILNLCTSSTNMPLNSSSEKKCL